MLLSRWADAYCDDHEYGVAAATRNQYRYSVTLFCRWLDREATILDLTDNTISRYVDWLRANRAAHTGRTQRGNLLTLWRAAWHADLVDRPPRKVRKLRMPRRIPTAFTPDEVARLAAFCGKIGGVFRRSRIRRGPNLEALVRTLWDTGLRLSDCLSVERGWILDGPNTITMVQAKTQVETVVKLYDSTIGAISATMADSPRRLIWPTPKRTIQEWMARAIAGSGIRPGCIKWIRRAVGTTCDLVQPETGYKALGHTSPRTMGWYRDLRQSRCVVRPPELDVP